MFKIESISFINGNDFQTYKFSSHTFVYGLNTVGKTALTKAIDYVLGSSDGLTYQGLDNIEGIEAYLTNGLTNLWIKRTISGNYYYKRTLESQYSEVSSEVYKDNICLIITPTSNARFVNVYSKVFDEKPTFRSFTFLNYIEEKGLFCGSSIQYAAETFVQENWFQNYQQKHSSDSSYFIFSPSS